MSAEPELVQFFKFYAEFDEEKKGFQIDLSDLFPDQYSSQDFQKIIDRPSYMA